jgi:putative endonuclease
VYYVYLLKSQETKKIYTGYSKDLKKRLSQHKSKLVQSTKGLGNLELIYYEAFKDKRDAIRREKYFKTTKGKRLVKLMLKYSL